MSQPGHHPEARNRSRDDRSSLVSPLQLTRATAARGARSGAGHAKFVGRIGALAVFLGVGTALATPGVAFADTDDSGSSTSTAKSPSKATGASSSAGRARSARADSAASSDSTATNGTSVSSTPSRHVLGQPRAGIVRASGGASNRVGVPSTTAATSSSSAEEVPTSGAESPQGSSDSGSAAAVSATALDQATANSLVASAVTKVATSSAATGTPGGRVTLLASVLGALLGVDTRNLAGAANSPADIITISLATGPLQYTFAAATWVAQSVIDNPIQMLFRPLRTAAYAISTVVDGLLTDLGVFKPNPQAQAANIQVRMAVRSLVHSGQVQAAIDQAVAYLLTTPSATTSAGAQQNVDILRQVITEYAYGVAIQTLSQNPGLAIITNTAYIGSRFGLDNPDTIYRGLTLDPSVTYVIRGNMNTSPYIALQITDGFYGDNGRTPRSLAVLDSTQMEIAEDGSFTITLSPDAPQVGQTNYIQLDPSAVQLIVRDSLTNWDQTMSTLNLQVVSGTPQPLTLSFDELADLTAANITAGAPYWYGFASYYRLIPKNILAPASNTAGGLANQSSSVGNFSLTENQALVITFDAFDGDYVGFEVGTDWYTSINYANHTSSLTTDQAIANADGTYTYVLSLTDPGVANWLDPAGHPTGLLQIRWQGLPESIPTGYMPTVRLVDIDDLASVLPAETVWVTDSERKKQISARQDDVRSRYAGIPASLLGFNQRTFEPLF